MTKNIGQTFGIMATESAVLLQRFEELSGSWMHGTDPIDQRQANTMIERKLKVSEKC